MKPALALAAAAAMASFAAPASRAADPAQASVQAEVAAKPAPECFFVRDIRNQTIGGNHVIYFNVRNRETYRIDVSGPCLAAAGPSDRVSVDSHGAGGQVCGKLDLEVRVLGGRCIVENVSKMTPQEVAAMPRRSDPQDLTLGFHLKPVLGGGLTH
ncbi:DUF6491 family protein [Phenylobacterium sp.]|uniref:DUF6491 family protein n=1 Tax=Phenylobacterium sp. TaxID=1871053 RepID=UPI002C0A2AD2|nr:DUF6491 family protein [Phenylobacterium sp.]HLZ75092.1 DUF6491 family protein [Phenylobacterium sp.]